MIRSSSKVALLIATISMLFLGSCFHRFNQSWLSQMQIAQSLVQLPVAPQLSLSGSLYRYNPTLRKTRPPALPGQRVYLYSNRPSRWIGPSITDSYGRFAFYDLSPGVYLLRIYPPTFRGRPTDSSTSGKQYLLQQEVKVPGRVQPIVLR